ncbi:MAG: hypothetical protein BWZ03_00066 [bacterium ADurb.BinA186]|nr:MAG: hypothetical protein BWZ03_00066 [bacterium ADurb.BinA186]
MTEQQAQKRAEETIPKDLNFRAKYGTIKATWIEAYMAAHHDQQKVIDKLLEVLGFYAQGGNFNRDLWHDEKLGYFTGKRAREALKQWKDGGV